MCLHDSINRNIKSIQVHSVCYYTDVMVIFIKFSFSYKETEIEKWRLIIGSTLLWGQPRLYIVLPVDYRIRSGNTIYRHYYIGHMIWKSELERLEFQVQK